MFFSPLVSKSKQIEKIKYTQKKELLRLLRYKKAHADLFRRFRNVKQKGLYVRISVKGTTAPVKERYCTK